MKNFILIVVLFLFSLSKKNDNIHHQHKGIRALKTTYSENTSQILFSRKNGSDNGWSIYGIHPDGTKEEVIIPFKSGQGEYNPSISPQDKVILFNTYRFGGWKLATYSMDTNKVNRISLGSNYYTNGAFSFDGKRIVYEKNIGKSTHIFISNLDGTRETNLTNTISNDNRAPCWSFDDKSILFYFKRNETNDVFSIDITTKKVDNLTNNSSGNDFNPSVSPDGKQVAFFSDRNGYLDLYVMDITGENQVCLTSDLHSKNNTYNYYKDSNLYWIFKVSWSPDGQYLVFSNIKSDNVDLFTIKKNGTKLRQITNTPKSEYTPVWGNLKN
ncbi:DPP IV N-terminal domain-containing protein [Aquimarina sp. AU474]|uniref:TolB family protein n=1 Tax=Aquimarina sp. AU474 TaxID=2108529 RepID=UPI000D68E5CF|nr:DPP IV N-terminal domain-containing protein [Aquimarina sp. AU474]